MLSIPYVLVLLFIQCLRKLSNAHNQVGSWVTRLIPLLDAYAGPYKPRYPFWTGFLLLVRNPLFLIFTFNYTDDPSLNLMAILIVSFLVPILAWCLRGVYKKWQLDILESSFFFNLGVTAAAMQYIRNHNEVQMTAVAYTSISIVFATFVGIVIYHTGCRIHAWEKLAKLKYMSVKRCFVRIPENIENDNQNMPPTEHWKDYREPLFEYMDDKNVDENPDNNHY